EEGLAASIRAGLEAASRRADGYMICLSDLPLVEPAELNALASAFREAVRAGARPIVVPVHRGRRGNPVVFAAHYRPELLAQRGPGGCKAVVERHPDHVVAVEMAADHVLRDVDTPEAYDDLPGVR